MKIDFKALIKIYGMLIMIEGLAMIPSGLCGLYYSEQKPAASFLISGAFCFILGFILFMSKRHYKANLKPRDGYLVAATSWVLCSVIGTFPIYFSVGEYTVLASFFESVASFTTTGCSVLNIELMPRALLFFRSISNWLGGMGILVLVVSLFPALGISGQAIAQIETTGPTLQKIGGRFSNTGKFLYLSYLSLSIIEFVLLTFSGMGIFYSLINTFSSISTGGLFVTAATKDIFASVYVRTVITVFTFLSSLNYTLYYLILTGRVKLALRNFELRVFVLIILVSSVVIAATLLISGTYGNVGLALVDSLCQVVSFISTSGYFVCDYQLWPSFTIIILFTLFFIGGCSMSTSGSLKVVRVVTLFKLLKRGVLKLIHPSSVKAVIIDGKAMPARKVSEITAHILLFFVMFIAGSLVLSLNNLDLEATITTTLAMFTNTGLALGETGMRGFFGDFNGFSQLVMCIMMIAGRLEMYAVIIIFTKSFWKPEYTK